MTAITKKKRHSRETVQDRILDTIFYIIIGAFMIICLYPVWFTIVASFSSSAAVNSGRMLLLPVGFQLKGYEFVFSDARIITGYSNTIMYTVCGTALGLVCSLSAGYALSRKDLPGRNIVMMLFVFTMYFGGGLIPGYLNLRDFGLLDTPWVMVVTGLVATYNMIVARTFFANTIPWELTEASYLDGASNFQLFTKVILPLSAPIIVVEALYYGVGHWNAYFNAMIWIDNRDLYPLQVFLKEILSAATVTEEFLQGGSYTPEEMEMLEAQAEVANRMKYCVIVVATAPMMMIYPRLQKYFAKGVMIGSVKG